MVKITFVKFLIVAEENGKDLIILRYSAIRNNSVVQWNL